MNTLWLTEHDYKRLRQLLVELTRDSAGIHAGTDTLEEMVDLARVVRAEAVPQNVVTMNSRVLFQDTRTGAKDAVVIVYPTEADASAGKISVLSPVGAALLGLEEGAEIELPLPHGHTRRIRILEVLYQPEAQGEYAL